MECCCTAQGPVSSLLGYKHDRKWEKKKCVCMGGLVTDVWGLVIINTCICRESLGIGREVN